MSPSLDRYRASDASVPPWYHLEQKVDLKNDPKPGIRHGETMGRSGREIRIAGDGADGPSPVRVRLWAGAVLTLLLAFCPPTFAQDVAGAVAESRALVPGETLEQRSEAGDRHRYRLPTDLRAPGGLLRIEVTQGEADVALVVYDAGGEMVARVDDAPSDHPGAEVAVIEAGPGMESVVLEVRVGRRGTYRIALEAFPRFDPATGTTADDTRRRLAAERFATVAATRRSTGGEAGRRDALELYRRAAELFAMLDDPARQASMVQRQADLWTELGDNDRALAELDQALALWRSAADPAGEAAVLLMRGVTDSRRGDDEGARQEAERAGEIFHRLGLACGEARAANNLGRLAQGVAPETARQHFAHALALCGDGREPELEGVLRLNMGGLHARLGELDQAIELSRQALPLLRALDQSWMVMRTLVNLGYYHRRLGELGHAFEHYGEALALAEHHGDRHLAATVHNSLGYLYLLLGEGDNALGHLDIALGLRREVEDRRGEAVTLANLARAHRLRGELTEARQRLDESLALRRRRGDGRGEARALGDLAEVALEEGAPGEALASLAIALRLAHEADDGVLASDLERTHGRALLAAGRPAEAAEVLRAEWRRSEPTERPLAVVKLLPVLAQAERWLGRYDIALEYLAEARTQAEALRTEIGDPELRASFSGAVAEMTEEEIAVRLELHRQEPGAHHAERAFEASERGRARGLLELLAEVEAGLRLDADPDLIARRGRLMREASLRADRRRRSKDGSEAARQLDQEIAERVAELRGIEETLQRQSPRWRALDPAALPGTEEIRALLDPATLLVEIALGERRSVLFALDRDHLVLHELPPRQIFEDDTRRLVELWSVVDPNPEIATRIARQLSDQLLAPLAGLLEGRDRLVVVADGALHTLPFAALPLPGSDGPLLERLEVVTLPSASWWALREGPVIDRTGGGSVAVAVLADPVFVADDSRLRGEPPRSSLSGGVESERSSFWGTAPPRLPASRHEALVIAALAGDDTLTLLGTDARLDALFDGTLDGRRVLHFATHGVLDGRHPRLSGLELSRFDAVGRPVSGFLSLAQLYDLRLDAELVVLSGCRTALGRSVRGEGLIGLPRGFLHAGARSVVASLWPVQDRTTAALMERFYRALLEDGERPASALRRAQLALRAEPAYRDPFHWAAFVAIGDWR